MSPLFKKEDSSGRKTVSREDRKADRQAEKTAREVDKLLRKKKPEELVLDSDRLREIRMEALNRITDDTVLASTLIALIKWQPKERYPDPYDRETRMQLITKAFPGIVSEKAMGMMKETVLGIRDHSFYLRPGLDDLIRRMNDRDCMLRLVNAETVHGMASKVEKNLPVIAEDIEHCKRLGASSLEIAKEIPSHLFHYFAPELADGDVIRFYADDPVWIDQNRDYLPRELVTEALKSSEHQREALLAYRIADGTVVRSECEFGRHDYVIDREEWEARSDEEQRHMKWTHYKCTRCGKRHVRVDDGWGRISEYDEE